MDSRFLSSSEDSGSSSQHNYGTTTVTFNIIATAIFVVVSYCFFLPCNRFIPLDRRSVAMLGATLCYATRSFFFPSNKLDLVEAVDFDVLVLLFGIMAINFIMVHQRETKSLIIYVQTQIQENPKRGFWLVSLAAFVVSPLLTNDGVCLLFVEPILNAFKGLSSPDDSTHSMSSVTETLSSSFPLEKGDAFYFLLALACSANIGSALTYTGNPQNMIVSSDAIDVLPPYKFLLYMLLPSVCAWLMTMAWIERCWHTSRESNVKMSDRSCHLENVSTHSVKRPFNDHIIMDQNTTAGQYHTNRIEKGDFTSTQDNGDDDYGDSKVNNMESQKGHIELIPHLQIDTGSSQHGNTDVLKSKPRLSPHYNKNRKSDAMTNDLIDKKKKKRSFVKTAIKYIITPFPYAMLVIMAIMVALMFVDMISISGLICITAVFMVVVLVLGNHYQGLPIYGTAENDGLLSPIPLPSMTTEEKIKNTEEFLEELFKSIDYNLLLIFLGLFIVVENIAHTGIPKLIWSNIVGRKPFGTASSVICISLFVLIVSQFLGNVAVVQLALPNVEQLTDSQRKYAWALISFVSTVGGNLTITGSAANIIVAEKAARIDPNSSITFYAHLKVCFVVTLVSCVLGALMITGISICEEATFGS